ncbi:putative glutathione S-transferase GSTU6 [Glycine soja]|uniref:GST N-terminal domain-containing protein n=2 Tax=Glycine soja TaxID=3848 RepID=A0A445JM38_GLYSO|nr:hypothetical protein D0Y65_022047 [Glycine soja]
MAKSDELKLMGKWSSPYAMRVKIALNIKSLEHEHFEETMISVIEQRYERKLLVEAKAPALVKWAERFVVDPTVKGLIPETDKLVEISKSLQIK